MCAFVYVCTPVSAHMCHSLHVAIRGQPSELVSPFATWNPGGTLVAGVSYLWHHLPSPRLVFLAVNKRHQALLWLYDSPDRWRSMEHLQLWTNRERGLRGARHDQNHAQEAKLLWRRSGRTGKKEV